MRSRTKADLHSLTANQPQPWWRRIQWIDVVLVIIGVVIVMTITMELWLPHYGLR
jgi:hypothetical protein